MKPEQQKQAESLFFQTNLSKTEIAQIIGVSRRTLHYWVQQNNWDRIRESAQVMPTALAGNCYLILARLQDNILSPERADKPITLQEVNTMHKLTLTIGKLNKRGALNENLELMTYFLEFLHAADPRMAEMLKPVVNEFIRARAGEYSVTAPVSAPAKENPAEAQLDLEDIAAWAKSGLNKEPVPQPTPSHVAEQPATTVLSSQDDQNTILAKQVLNNQNTKPAPTHMLKGKPNNRAARRALARAAA